MTTVRAQLPCFSVAEWQSIDLKGKALVGEDRRLAERLDTGDSRLVIDELKDGLRVSAKSWVGMVRFQGFELQVVPKLVGDNLALVELIDFARGLDALHRYPSVRQFKGSGTCLFDLIALLLVESCERLLRGGLLSDYCELEDDLPVVRGRILMEKQVLKRFGRIDRLECRHDEYLTDIVENRLLLAALSVCAGRVGHPGVSLRVRRLLAVFSEACDLINLDLRLVRSLLSYDRKNEHYRGPHEMAWLVLDGLGIEDIYTKGPQQCFAFLLDMNRLFEDFIARWLKQSLPQQYRIRPQHRDRSILWSVELSRPYASVIPDLLIERVDHPGRFLPVDAKYKLYDQRSIGTGDIYQTFLYAFAYGETHSSLPTALLLYPASVSESASQRLHVRRQGGATSAELQAIAVHIPTALAEARRTTLGEVGSRIQQAIAGVLNETD
jgi:5-methylcytosine-specific restriction enzyme subunit McrC